MYLRQILDHDADKEENKDRQTNSMKETSSTQT